MKNILKKELIGNRVKIDESKNKKDQGIEGEIIDETRDTITIETCKGTRRVMKKNITLMLTEKGLRIKGDLLVGRPEERIKKK